MNTIFVNLFSGRQIKIAEKYTAMIAELFNTTQDCANFVSYKMVGVPLRELSLVAKEAAQKAAVDVPEVKMRQLCLEFVTTGKEVFLDASAAYTKVRRLRDLLPQVVNGSLEFTQEPAALKVGFFAVKLQIEFGDIENRLGKCKQMLWRCAAFAKVSKKAIFSFPIAAIRNCY